jgi:hypothetical protein
VIPADSVHTVSASNHTQGNLMLVIQVRRSVRLAILLAVTGGLVCLQSTSFRAAETLPSQISDESFWKMVKEFSEDDGYFMSENFSSNERGYQLLIPKLQATVRPGGAYLGVGPEQNFQYIVSLRPKIAFIIDIRRQNMIQHLMYKAAFEMSANRAEFLSLIFSRARPRELTEASGLEELFDAYLGAPRDAAIAEANRKAIKDLLIRKHGFDLTEDDERSIDHVFDVFAAFGPTLSYSSNIDELGRAIPGRGGANNVFYSELMLLVDDSGVNRSYLASEDNFRFMKQLEEKNLLVPVVGNFAGPKAIRAVGQYLKDHGAIVGAFYLSNVEQYLFRPPQGGLPIHQEFYESVATLPLDSSSTFIRSGNSPDRGRGGGLTPMMSSMIGVLNAFKNGRIDSQNDLLLMSTR